MFLCAFTVTVVIDSVFAEEIAVFEPQHVNLGRMKVQCRGKSEYLKAVWRGSANHHLVLIEQVLEANRRVPLLAEKITRVERARIPAALRIVRCILLCTGIGR